MASVDEYIKSIGLTSEEQAKLLSIKSRGVTIDQLDVADQVANSFAYVVVRSDGAMVKEILYRGEPGDNIPRLFVESLVKTKALITDLLIKSSSIPMKLSPDEWQSFESATHCYICGKEFPYGNAKFTEAKLETNTESIPDDTEHKQVSNDDLTTENFMEMLDDLLVELHDPKNVTKVKKKKENKRRKDLNELGRFYNRRDHDHVTGKFRGAAHMACNSRLKVHPNKTPIPVVFHNLQGYDGHLVIQGLHNYNEIDPDAKIHCIPHNMEKYMSFTV